MKAAKEQRIKPRVLRDLRFNPETVNDWALRDFLAVWTRSGNDGVLVSTLGEELSLTPFSMSRTITDAKTGRSKSVTCDLCYTWQRGNNAASIALTRRSDGHTRAVLCCADLLCSLHVRNLTPQAKLSRSQLHEDMTTEQRVERLQRKLHTLLTELL